MSGHDPRPVEHLELLGAEADQQASSGVADRDRVEGLADTHPRFRIDPTRQFAGRVEHLARQTLQRLAVKGSVLGDGEEPAADVTLRVIGGADAVQQFIELDHRRDVGNGNEGAASEPADLTFDPALLMRAFDAGLAEERVEPVARAQQHEPFGLDPVPTAQHLDHRGLQVVVADP